MMRETEKATEQYYYTNVCAYYVGRVDGGGLLSYNTPSLATLQSILRFYMKGTYISSLNKFEYRWMKQEYG